MEECRSVSVVMSVFDKPDDVIKTIESVLAQSNVDLEFVIINDGASPEVIEGIESFDDPRIIRINQTNEGLTKALIKGCKAANGPFIARIDAGDVMLPGRLSSQLKLFSNDPQLGIVGCSVQMVTEEGYFLFDVKIPIEELKVGLVSTNKDDFKSFVHSSVMFRKQAYDQVGGYRSEFYFTQDCDLWSRVIMAGFDIGMIEEVMQTNVFSTSGLSGQYRNSQQALEKIIVRMNQLRSKGQSDLLLLDEAKTIRPTKKLSKDTNSGSRSFDGDYFIASILTKTSPKQALTYWKKALSAKPYNLKAWLKTILCWLKA